MFPEITFHRPQGVVPKLAVRKRTVVEYQPSWLLLALPVLAVLRARRKQSAVQARPPQAPPADVPDLRAHPKPRRRPVQVVLVSVTRLRRRPVPTTPTDPLSPVSGKDGTVVSPVAP